MVETLQQLDTASTLSTFLQTANRFEMIANAEGDKWLPYYYAAMCNAIGCFMDTVAERRDSYLDKAGRQIDAADELEPDNSEIYTLKGMIAQARMTVNPMERWAKYGPIATQFLEKAIELNPANPRPDLLIGQSIYYTPEQFGGGFANAEPHLLKAKEKFETFEPESDLHPDWGFDQLMVMLEAGNNSMEDME
jgi:hypothetical protein